MFINDNFIQKCTNYWCLDVLNVFFASILISGTLTYVTPQLVNTRTDLKLSVTNQFSLNHKRLRKQRTRCGTTPC